MILPSSPSELDSDAAVSSAVAASKSSPDALYELSDAGSHSLSSDATAGSSLSVLRSVPSPHLLLLILQVALRMAVVLVAAVYPLSGAALVELLLIGSCFLRDH
ncbi:hypothetical protein L915_08444 [Phytophthora nicotianae]|nr:hypothetical protein L915_08444 [Phytophthora nicotianae]ETL40450.1 hypothetical protein L916_08368 [Phytophthora nicotianae]